MSHSSKKDVAKRAMLRRPHKDDFHEQREHEQKYVGMLRHVSDSIARRRRSDPQAPVLRKIAVATDLSLSSCRAVDLAVDLAMRSGAELVVVHCVETTVPPYPVPLTPDVATLASAARKALDREMQRVRETVPGARRQLLQGCVVERISAFVERGEIDLLVLGVTDATACGLLGTAADKVTESVRVPVLVVRPSSAWVGRVWLP